MDNMKNQTIELQVRRDGKDVWERSWSFPDRYTMDEAQRILDRDNGGGLSFRITPWVRKPYRRHAAVTPLELRGAL
jgi:hypothetical protein